MTQEIEQFLAKVNAFAETLEPSEQSMLAYLVGDGADSADGADDDDVSGFNFFEAWPAKIVDIAPIKIDSLKTDFGTILSSGHTTGALGEPGKGGT